MSCSMYQVRGYEDGENMKVAMLYPMAALPSETLKRNIGQVCLGKVLKGTELARSVTNDSETHYR